MDERPDRTGTEAVPEEEETATPQAAMEAETGSAKEAIAAGSIAYLSLLGEINDISQEYLLETCYECHHRGIETVYLFMSTSGGSVRCGVTMYNVIKNMPFTLITHNVGLVASVGNVVFLAGEMRLSVETGHFLFHEVFLSPPSSGELEISRRDLDRWTDDIEFSENQIREVIKERTSMQKADIDQSFRRQATEDAAFALTNNIIHGISRLEIVEGSEVWAIPWST